MNLPLYRPGAQHRHTAEAIAAMSQHPGQLTAAPPVSLLYGKFSGHPKALGYYAQHDAMLDCAFAALEEHPSCQELMDVISQRLQKYHISQKGCETLLEPFRLRILIIPDEYPALKTLQAMASQPLDTRCIPALTKAIKEFTAHRDTMPRDIRRKSYDLLTEFIDNPVLRKKRGEKKELKAAIGSRSGDIHSNSHISRDGHAGALENQAASPSQGPSL